MDKLFNFIVLTAFSLTVVFWVIPDIDHMWLSDEELALLNTNGWKSLLPDNLIINWFILVIWAIVSVGLIKRINQLRTLYLVVLIADTIFTFIWGYQVYSPIEAGITNIITLLDGSIITMAYFTSVREGFEKKA